MQKQCNIIEFHQFMFLNNNSATATIRKLYNFDRVLLENTLIIANNLGGNNTVVLKCFEGHDTAYNVS